MEIRLPTLGVAEHDVGMSNTCRTHNRLWNDSDSLAKPPPDFESHLSQYLFLILYGSYKQDENNVCGGLPQSVEAAVRPPSWRMR